MNAFDMLRKGVEDQYDEAVKITQKEFEDKLSSINSLPDSEAKTMLITGLTTNKDAAIEKLLATKNEKLTKIADSMQELPQEQAVSPQAVSPQAVSPQAVSPQAVSPQAVYPQREVQQSDYMDGNPGAPIPESTTINSGGALKEVILDRGLTTIKDLNESLVAFRRAINKARVLLTGTDGVEILDLLEGVADNAMSNYIEALTIELRKRMSK